MLIFIVSVWSLATNLLGGEQSDYEDLIDDLVSIYHWFKRRFDFGAELFRAIEKLGGIPRVRSILSWLNPRRHPWNIIVLVAIVMGISLAAIEALSEGASSNLNIFVLVASVFIGIESAGLLLGYGLLSGYLGFFTRAKSL